MPLHPQIKGMLDGLVTAGVPSFHQMSVEQSRSTFRELVLSVPASTATIEKVTDRTGTDVPAPLRIYTPTGSGPFPILLYLHGGGWVLGDLDSYDSVCRELCAGTQCIVVSADYRRAPEHPFPAAADDALATLKWIVANAQSIGGDSDRIAVAGDSAGGNLAAVTALRAKWALPGRVKAQLLIYPVTDHYSNDSASMRDLAEGYFLTRNDMIWFTDQYLIDSEDKFSHLFNLLHAPLDSDLPPAFVMTAEYDPLCDEGEAFASALARAGVEIERTRYDGAIHGFFSFFTVLDVGRTAMDDACRWLKRRFKTT